MNMRHPHVLQLIMDSLRYWVTWRCTSTVSGSISPRHSPASCYEVDRLSAFFDIIQQDPVISQVKLIAEPWDVGEGGYQVGKFPPHWSEWNGKLPRHDPRLLARRAGGAGRVRLSLHRQLRPVRGRHPQADRLDQLHHLPRRLHARRSGVVQRQAQRCQRRGQPRRRVTQPLVEPRRRGSDRRPGDQRAAGPPAAQPDRHAAAVAGRADDLGRRRDRPHPGRQQQRLLPGQRALLARLGARRRRDARLGQAASSTSSASIRCSGAGAGSRAARSAAWTTCRG